MLVVLGGRKKIWKISLCIEDQFVEEVPASKYFGVWQGKRRSFSHHIQKAVVKAEKTVCDEQTRVVPFES